MCQSGNVTVINWTANKQFSPLIMRVDQDDVKPISEWTIFAPQLSLNIWMDWRRSQGNISTEQANPVFSMHISFLNALHMNTMRYMSDLRDREKKTKNTGKQCFQAHLQRLSWIKRPPVATHVSDLGFTRVERLLDACYSHPLTERHMDICTHRCVLCLYVFREYTTHTRNDPHSIREAAHTNIIWLIIKQDESEFWREDECVASY